MTTDISASTSRPTDAPTTAAKRKGIVTSVWGADYASMALMLGWTIMQHNDLKSLDAEMVLLTLRWYGRGIGLTTENKTRLEKVGWNIKELDQIHIEGIDFSQIQSHRRNNLNKLQPFGWAEYEKILYLDADTVVKGDFGELFDMPGGTYWFYSLLVRMCIDKTLDFAAVPDVWFDIQIDSRFNSGVMIFRPSRDLFLDMMAKIGDTQYHDPHEGDQDFLQRYWKFRDWKLPFKYNLNIVMYAHYPNDFNALWDEAIVVHFTTQKPSPDHTKFCRKPLIENGKNEEECGFWGILDVSLPSMIHGRVLMLTLGSGTVDTLTKC